MKAQLLLPLTTVVSVVLFGYMKLGKQEREKEDKRFRFQGIKLRVTSDVLAEYLKVKAERQTQVDKTLELHKSLTEEADILQKKAEKAKGVLDVCHQDLKVTNEALASNELVFNNLKAETEKETSTWTTEMDTLKQKLATRSEVCNFLKDKSQVASTLCGDENQKEPKAEAPKPEDAKAEAPKPEDAKAEAPKPEEAKAEAPKPEEAKAEAPKPEEAKAEAPKPEEAKAEAPKPQGEKKAETL